MTTTCYSIKGGDYERGGYASACLKEMLKRVGVEPQAVRRAVIAAYEAEMNVVIHAYRGQMDIRLNDGRIDVDVLDEGPGIPDIELAMKEGYSTAPPIARELGFGAGMGLPNIKRNSDVFGIESAVGRGTRVSFSIAAKAQEEAQGAKDSIRITSERCTGCLRCLAACPTRALRLRAGQPHILSHLCIDCTSCISACPTGALKIDIGAAAEAGKDTALVLPPEFLVQFGGGVSVERVLAALGELGFRRVIMTEPYGQALREAVISHADGHTVPLPVISPICPAVVNLITLRFPSLIPSVAPFVSPIEAAAKALGDQAGSLVTICPCLHTALARRGDGGRRTVVLPERLRQEVLCLVTASKKEHRAADQTAAGGDELPGQVLRVYGIQHAISVLNRVEDGFLGDVAVVEAFACEQGCFGSPLLHEDPFVARHRWLRAGRAYKAQGEAVARKEALRARTGVRLAADMATAIANLRKVEDLARSLPGKNCAACGAPTCDAFAEDVVMGRAALIACPHAAGKQEDRT